MGVGQIVFGTVLVVVLVALSGFYAQRQVVTLRRLRQHKDSLSEEDVYLRSQARRRLINSVLMALLAVLLVMMMLWLEGPAQRLGDKIDAMPEANRPPLSPEDRSFAYLYSVFLFTFMLVLFIILVITGIDAWATRQYGMKQYRKLMADRRAMIERQVARLREERNGEE